MNAILVLDKTLTEGAHVDNFYHALRKKTFIVVLNCNHVGEYCFCRSMGTGPFLHADEGYDLLLTDLEDRFLVEVKSEKAKDLLDSKFNDAAFRDAEGKSRLEDMVNKRFTKTLNTDGLPEIIRDNVTHPVWERVGEGLCLSCTSCTMVCPTCFCYNVVDKVSLDLKKVERIRYWDSCQDRGFAEVHGGNFRSSRSARLRQFVSHKLSHWVEQSGCFGCIGCGRCMTWCPVDIDLVEISSEIRETVER